MLMAHSVVVIITMYYTNNFVKFNHIIWIERLKNINAIILLVLCFVFLSSSLLPGIYVSLFANGI